MKNNPIKKVLSEFFGSRPNGYVNVDFSEMEKQQLIEIARKYGFEESIEEAASVETNEVLDEIIKEDLIIEDVDQERIEFIVKQMKSNPELVNELYREVNRNSEEE